MKRLICISCILVLLVVISVLGVSYIDSTKVKMGSAIDSISDLLSNRDLDSLDDTTAQKITTLCDNLQSDWEQRSNVIGTFAMHDTIDTLERSFTSLYAYAYSGHFDSMLPLIEEIRFHLHHLYEQELPKLKNIL